MMNKSECEAKLLEKAKEIEQIIMEYNPNNKYFVMFVTDDALGFNNDYWENEKTGKGSGYDAPIDFYELRGGDEDE